MAGSSITKTTLSRWSTSTIKAIEISWVADDTDGSVPTLEIGDADIVNGGWYLIRAITDPGATAPTDNYDIAGNGTYGDFFNAQLANRDTATTEYVDNIAYPVIEAFTVAVTNNSVNSATGKIVLVFSKLPTISTA